MFVNVYGEYFVNMAFSVRILFITLSSLLCIHCNLLILVHVIVTFA